MSGNKIHSLRFYINMLLGIFLLLFLFLIAINNTASIGHLKNNICENAGETTALYQKEMDHRLMQIRTYLNTLLTNDADFTTIYTADSLNNTAFTISQYHLINSFRNALNTYSCKSFFCYLSSDNYLISATTSGNELSYSEEKEWLSYILSQENSLPGIWQFHSTADHTYLVLYIQKQEAFLGCLLDVNELFSAIAPEDAADDLSLVDSSGFIHDGLYKDTVITLPPSAEEGAYLFQKTAGVNYYTAFSPLRTCSYSLVRFVPSRQISLVNRSLWGITLLVMLGFLLVWAIFYKLIHSYVVHPVLRLTDAIQEVAAGTLGSYIPDEKQPFEFFQLSRVYNDMLAEIRSLKIDVYEKIVENQKLEIQYLKQQITPHFMINCLNTVYSLLDTSRFDLARQLLSELSVHIRYTLSSGQTVSLKEELRLVQNYIELSSIRYPGAIRYEPQIEEGVEAMTGIPLLVLNFIENTIKYEVKMGRLLEIHVGVKREIYKNTDCLHITIWDSGNGFENGLLARLQNHNFLQREQNSHIGIYNTVYRSSHAFPISEFNFSNREGAGAQIDIHISALPYTAAERNQL